MKKSYFLSHDTRELGYGIVSSLQTTVEPNTSGSVTLLSDMRKHYPIINIKIKQCYQVLSAAPVMLSHDLCLSSLPPRVALTLGYMA